MRSSSIRSANRSPSVAARIRQEKPTRCPRRRRTTKRSCAALVKDGRVVAEGMNRVVASHDPTWHAEMEAIRVACVTLQSFKLPGCVLYTSAEPCPMCMAACHWASIEQVFYAASVDDADKYGDFDDRPIYEQLALPNDRRSIKLTQMLRDGGRGGVEEILEEAGQGPVLSERSGVRPSRAPRQSANSRRIASTRFGSARKASMQLESKCLPRWLLRYATPSSIDHGSL